MPDSIHRPLAQRIGPERAGAIKASARRWYEQDGLSPREIARKILEAHDFEVTHATVNSWAKRGYWVRAATPKPDPEDTKAKRKQEMTEKGAKAGAVKCRRRCPTCFALIEAGETHICQIRAGKTLSMFGGGYL